MNPFQFQAQMLEAWASASLTVFSSALDMWSQSMGLAKAGTELRPFVPLPFGSASSFGSPAWPMWPAPAAFQSFVSPTSFAGWPFSSSFSAPLASPFFFPFQFASPFASLQTMNWPSGPAAWPMMVLFMPAQTPAAFRPFANPWWGSADFAGQFGRGAEMLGPRDVLEQMATSYRTASGYAAAIIMGPAGSSLAPKEDGVPFWMLPSDKPRRDVN